MDDDVLILAVVVAVGLIPWLGLAGLGTWSEPELGVATVILLASVPELLRTLARGARSRRGTST